MQSHAKTQIPWDEAGACGRQPQHGLHRWWTAALDLLLPRQCLACHALIEGEGALCADCWSKIRFIAPPYCACCGRPFELPADAATVCAACLRQAPTYARARAAVAYDDASKRLILAFKNADRLDVAPTLASWMARAGYALLAEADLLAPVPLHWTRLLLRRYNQAALLAHGIGRVSGVPVVADLLVRHQRTRKLGTSGPAEREKIVKGAIAVARRHIDRVTGRRIVLVDDVLTTGATVNACCRALLARGAAQVDVLALARVLRPER